MPMLPSPFCEGEESHRCLQGGHLVLAPFLQKLGAPALSPVPIPIY